MLSLFCSYNVFVVMKFVSSNLDTMGGRRVRVKTKGFIKPLALGFEFARGGEGFRVGFFLGLVKRPYVRQSSPGRQKG